MAGQRNATIGVVNAGIGNVRSIIKMLEWIHLEAREVGDPDSLGDVTHLILPGVGAFDFGMRSLRQSGFDDGIKEFARSGRPLMGICLGMQLLGTSSEEGSERGLELMPVHYSEFKSSATLRVPHMGWNQVKKMPGNSKGNLLADLEMKNKFYFVHSYHAVCAEQSHVLGATEYGSEFPSIVGVKNVLGVQFHPEKSHRYGMKLLANFASMEAP